MAFLRRIWNKWQNLLHDEKLKHKIYVIIFESDTPMGKLFDVALIGFIVLSILVVSEILPFVVLANRSKSTFYKILYHETKF